jgi:hypothetical protein
VAHLLYCGEHANNDTMIGRAVQFGQGKSHRDERSERTGTLGFAMAARHEDFDARQGEPRMGNLQSVRWYILFLRGKRAKRPLKKKG